MLYLTCTTITSIDLAHYGVSRAKDRVSVKCGTCTSVSICLLAYVGVTCAFNGRFSSVFFLLLYSVELQWLEP